MARHEFASFREFWPYYVGEHRHPHCRLLHYVGAMATLACLAWAALGRDWRPLLAAPIVGYGFAWVGHLLIERNRPATWSHIRWSLLAEYKMLFFALTGRMQSELARLDEGRADRSRA